MTKETLEHLSCLMDGELTSDAGRFLARRVGSDDELGDTWQRYHLIRECMRRPGESLTMTRLEIDYQALDAMEAESAPARSAPGWLKPVMGGAIAASVAAVAVTLTLSMNPSQQADQLEPFASPNSSVFSPVSQPASFSGSNAASQQSLNRYLLRHNQAAGAVGQKGFVSFVPILATAPVQVVEADEDPAADSANPDVPAGSGGSDDGQP